MSEQKRFLGEDYQALFGRQWAPWAAGLLVGMLNVMMFAYAKPWGVADGVRNWGNWVLLGFGLPVGELASPIMFTTSVTNLSLILGAFIAALLSGQFVLRFSYRRDVIRSVLGGVLLGIGSVLGIGCTIGGFFSAFSALSLAGPLFMVGLFFGAFFGLKLLKWDLAREKPRAPKPPPRRKSGGIEWRRVQPLIGLAVLVLVLLVLLWDEREFTYAGITGRRSVLVLLGLALGLVNQRARFCFVRAFREPFMTGEGGMSKAVAIALLVGVAGFAIIKGTDLSDMRDPAAFVNPSVWLGSLAGGLIFGIGMVLVGGCASGSLWRAGEGQLKFVLVLLVFAVTNSLFAMLLRSTNWREAWGDDAYFLPDYLGWPAAMILLVAIVLAWIALVAWNEKTEKLVSG